MGQKRGREGCSRSGFVGLMARAGGGGGPGNKIPRARPFCRGPRSFPVHPPRSVPRAPLPSGLSLRLHTAAAGTSRAAAAAAGAGKKGEAES